MIRGAPVLAYLGTGNQWVQRRRANHSRQDGTTLIRLAYGSLRFGC